MVKTAQECQDIAQEYPSARTAAEGEVAHEWGIVDDIACITEQLFELIPTKP
jgi:hypothetical protein